MEEVRSFGMGLHWRKDMAGRCVMGQCLVSGPALAVSAAWPW
jgi:hypothetical protein